ncbi:hypothetical protein LCGC14_1849700 [marine sediment metagenome]|uniref:Uncharacterized protein n=1 Tax=marine sediment metagenome TaxID=412755 RepID=A0A0F9GAN9_9ZZZZ
MAETKIDTRREKMDAVVKAAIALGPLHAGGLVVVSEKMIG